MDNKKIAVIIGAGPAGLTAAYELASKTDIRPVIYESSGYIGGISRTIDFKGNRIDIGGHRFFSRSDRIEKWWLDIFPLQGRPSRDDVELEREVVLSEDENAPDPEKEDNVMLSRRRLSRIFFMRKFFDYPISLTFKTFSALGFIRVVRIGASYVSRKLFPLKKEDTLEEFFINRFGEELYKTFFKDYTHKVWGVPCSEIPAEWGAQRIKGLSIQKVIMHFIKRSLGIQKKQEVETSLIDRFMYPKLGPGQLWEECAGKVRSMGGEVYLDHRVIGVIYDGGNIRAVRVKNMVTGEEFTSGGDYFFSSMPVKDLIGSFEDDIPPKVEKTAEGLVYRDFVTVGLLLKKLKIKNRTNIRTVNDIVPDNWIYVQESDVRLGRIQIFNNWSPYMVRDKDTVWIGMEYFCNDTGKLWNSRDNDIADMAVDEAVKTGFIEKEDVIDSIVIRMPKAYPAYFGTYEDFHIIREFTDRIENLFLVGRNGMHRYNNQDHSMLSSIVAVENIINGVKKKDNIWDVNIEKEYHENK